MEGQYSGVDILEALESAHNYNDYLTRLIRESTESRDLIDFGAGIGTFSKRLRNAGYDHMHRTGRGTETKTRGTRFQNSGNYYCPRGRFGFIHFLAECF